MNEGKVYLLKDAYYDLDDDHIKKILDMGLEHINE